MNELPVWAIYVAFLVGVVGRVAVPYLLKWFTEKSRPAWDWRYLGGQLVGAFIALIPMIVAENFLSTLGAMSLLPAFGYGWFAADLGREGDKVVRPPKEG